MDPAGAGVEPGFRLEGPCFHADPYPTYAALRAVDPVHESSERGRRTLVLTRHRDILGALCDSRLCAPRYPTDLLRALARGSRPFAPARLQANPPEYSSARLAMSRVLRPRSVERWGELARSVAAELAWSLAGAGEGDFVLDFAGPLPLAVMARLLRLGGDGAGVLARWSEALSGLADRGDSQLAAAATAGAALRRHLHVELSGGRWSRGDDLIRAVAAYEGPAGAVDADDLFEVVALMLAAGHETTQDLIANGVLALLRTPGSLERLARKPAGVPSAVEELLRFDAPVQMIVREAVAATEVGGVLVGKGDQLHLYLGAANRDPEVFARPDELLLERTPNRHLSFGFGRHRCLAWALARLEAQVAVATVAERLPGLALVGEPRWKQGGGVLRGVASLPVRVGPVGQRSESA